MFFVRFWILLGFSVMFARISLGFYKVFCSVCCMDFGRVF